MHAHTHTLHLLNSSIRQETLKLLPCLSYCKQSCNQHFPESLAMNLKTFVISIINYLGLVTKTSSPRCEKQSLYWKFSFLCDTSWECASLWCSITSCEFPVLPLLLLFSYLVLLFTPYFQFYCRYEEMKLVFSLLYSLVLFFVKVFICAWYSSFEKILVLESSAFYLCSVYW